MSACNSYRELLMDALYGEISAADRTAFETHSASCSDCREDFERLRRVSSELRTWEQVDAPVLARTWPARRRGLRHFLGSPRLAWSAAALALLLGLLLRADLRIGGGVVQLSFALPGVAAAPYQAAPAALDAEQVAAAIQNAVAVSEERQRRELALVLATMVEQIETDMAHQFYSVQSNLDRLENTTFRVVNASQAWGSER
ncbi:MAG TPA: zf-HC2 domain-containing protein [Acidobacteriota bacterium]